MVSAVRCSETFEIFGFLVARKTSSPAIPILVRGTLPSLSLNNARILIELKSVGVFAFASSVIVPIKFSVVTKKISVTSFSGFLSVKFAKSFKFSATPQQLKSVPATFVSLEISVLLKKIAGSPAIFDNGCKFCSYFVRS